ncbi:chromodomain Y-like protein 2 isoform X1 [Xiphophorus maculatus]|uniref:Chromodomain Y like 2 n=2 Tax=Xiphophorus maculatus TaxID=8083 RepID=M3ZLQ9_XIPMA|nr:chromodomain Y-like protein 2 isoform X1 [Xiphophorus maculatus]XP_027871165.1 chromodomain Y-like protein 2 isoform X1 [Xiphophorus couchianus]XP_032417130.1 chromodomain Y-like protein 2 isoform X1 [Xiphophorus hellerii]
MASGDLYEVERIVDKRRNKKGKWEYLIRWKGYGRKEDTWEPEHHLMHCEEFIDQFNSSRWHSHKRPKIPKNHGEPLTASQHSATENSRARSEARKKKRTSGPAVGMRVGPVLGIGSGGSGLAHKQKKVGAGAGKPPLGERMSKAMTYKAHPSSGPHCVALLRVPHNGLQNGEMEPLVYSTAPRSHRLPSDRGETELGQRDTTGSQFTTELGSSLTNGKMHLHSSVKRKLAEEKGYVFDKRLRYNVRQNESNCRFRDIVVRKEEGFTHVLLSSQTTDNNALTPEIMKEVCRALGNAAADDSKLLLLSSVGTVFCSGLEPSYLIGRLSTDRRKESSRIAEAVRDFVLAFIHFKKPIVVAINGPALGLGASILPLCDVVWASERAWFQTPCAALHLTPSGCSSYTFPQILGVALANEMLFCGRKLTAQEACSRGLVSQVFWPTTFNQEVMLRVKEMASCNALVLEESKCLVRSILISVLEEVNEKECQMLKQLWCSTKGLEALFSYVHNKNSEK